MSGHSQAQQFIAKIVCKLGRETTFGFSVAAIEKRADCKRPTSYRHVAPLLGRHYSSLPSALR